MEVGWTLSHQSSPHGISLFCKELKAQKHGISLFCEEQMLDTDKHYVGILVLFVKYIMICSFHLMACSEKAIWIIDWYTRAWKLHQAVVSRCMSDDLVRQLAESPLLKITLVTICIRNKVLHSLVLMTLHCTGDWWSDFCGFVWS